MAVLITGGRGFLGWLLVEEILRRRQLDFGSQADIGPETVPALAARTLDGEDSRQDSDLRDSCWARNVIVFDQQAPEDRHKVEGVHHVVGDICNEALLGSALEEHGIVSVFHLAAVLSGQSETDYELGFKVNVEATRALIRCCRATGRRVKVVMASSVAVFGRPSVAGTHQQGVDFTEDSPVLPRSSYGMEKAVSELILSDATRRGFVDARTVRLPTVIVRPGRPNSATSSFCSGIIREPLRGEPSCCPVASDLRLWVQSPRTVVANLLHAQDVELGRASTVITLPGITTTPREMVRAVELCGGDPTLVEWKVDDFVNSVVSSWPGFIRTPTALSLGFQADRDILTIVKQYLDSLKVDSSALRVA